MEEIKRAKREGRLQDALGMLLAAIEQTENEAGRHGYGVAPWYYWHAAIVYRKLGQDDDELEILRRFAKQPHAPGARVPKLLQRLQEVEAKRVESETGGSGG
ncbi:MAG: hypothetical protein WEG36_12325 [Gemmatimonadota bacterium]